MSLAVAAAPDDTRRPRRVAALVLLGSIVMAQPAAALVAPAPIVMMMTKRQAKRLRKKSNMVSIVVDDDGTASKDKVSGTPDLTSEIRALVKSSSSTSSPRMPPWLANYDDLLLEDSGSSNTLLNSSGNKYGLGLLTTRMGDEPSKVARTNVSRLKAALERHHKYLGVESECFSQEDIADVMDALRVASGGDYALLAGAAEFLWLLLSVEENQFTGKGKELVGQVKPQTLFDDEAEDNDAVLVEDGSTNGREQKRPLNIFTRDTLIASAFHYADCVEARRTGVYGLVSQAVRGMSSTSSFADSWKRQLLPAPTSQLSEGETRDDKESVAPIQITIIDDDDGKDDMTPSSSAPTIKTSDELISQFGEDAARIAEATARIKKAEVLADTVAFARSTNPEGLVESQDLTVRGPTPSIDEADTLRSLLISVSEDWRGLAIRSVACLYRLRGIVQFGGGERTSEVAKAAREAVRVYAPIAGRLGMHRLKANLEELAFGILYRRQYEAAAVLFEQNGDVMHDIEAFATSNVEELLSSDDMLMAQVDSLKVSSRVKQPYSLWKKLLKRRTRGGKDGKDKREELSVQNLGDAVALRVVLQAKHLSPAETEETIVTREALLCYYVQKKIMERFPATDESMIKDYISYPKPNGYQSLHYTADVFRNGVDWLFEVQVRSAEMHRLAEFGVAAHWDYKMQQGSLVTADNVDKSAVPLATASNDMPREEDLDVIDESDVNGRIAEFDVSPSSNEEEEKDTESALDVSMAMGDNMESDEDDRNDRCSSYIEALTSAQAEIKSNKVFVFVSSTASASDGKILPLSLGATVADALKEAGDRYGMDLGESKLLCNGQVVGLGDELANGDVVVISQ